MRTRSFVSIFILFYLFILIVFVFVLWSLSLCLVYLFFFFFNDPATTEIYTYVHTLSLHDARPIWSLYAIERFPWFSSSFSLCWHGHGCSAALGRECRLPHRSGRSRPIRT